MVFFYNFIKSYFFIVNLVVYSQKNLIFQNFTQNFKQKLRQQSTIKQKHRHNNINKSQQKMNNPIRNNNKDQINYHLNQLSHLLLVNQYYCSIDLQDNYQEDAKKYSQKNNHHRVSSFINTFLLPNSEELQQNVERIMQKNKQQCKKSINLKNLLKSVKEIPKLRYKQSQKVFNNNFNNLNKTELTINKKHLFPQANQQQDFPVMTPIKPNKNKNYQTHEQKNNHSNSINLTIPSSLSLSSNNNNNSNNKQLALSEMKRKIQQREKQFNQSHNVTLESLKKLSSTTLKKSQLQQQINSVNNYKNSQNQKSYQKTAPSLMSITLKQSAEEEEKEIRSISPRILCMQNKNSTKQSIKRDKNYKKISIEQSQYIVHEQKQKIQKYFTSAKHKINQIQNYHGSQKQINDNNKVGFNNCWC